MANDFRLFRGAVGVTPTVIVPEQGGTNISSESRPAASKAIVFNLNLSNIDGTSAVFVTVDIFNGSTATVVVQDLEIPQGQAFYVDKAIVLEGTDRLRVSTAFTGDVVASASTIIQT